MAIAERSSADGQMLPVERVGFLEPLRTLEENAYQFYLAQRIMHTGACPVALSQATADVEAFSAGAVSKSEARIESGLDALEHKGSSLNFILGIPLVAALGWEVWSKRLAAMRAARSVPVFSDFECVLSAFRALGVRNIALADKWNEGINRQLTADLGKYAGVEVVGLATDPMTASDVAAIRPSEGVEIASALCERAMAACDTAPDAVFLAGGAWYSTAIQPSLEQRFGVPVITNPGAAMWFALHRVGHARLTPELGRLFAVSPTAADLVGAPPQTHELGGSS